MTGTSHVGRCTDLHPHFAPERSKGTFVVLGGFGSCIEDLDGPIGERKSRDQWQKCPAIVCQARRQGRQAQSSSPGLAHDEPTHPRSSHRSTADRAECSIDHHRLLAGADRDRHGDGSSRSRSQHRRGRAHRQTLRSACRAFDRIFPKIVPLDRTEINSWEDVEFVRAVKATGRKKLIMTAIWTEACLTFPALDALRERYEVYPVVDACGGASPEGHLAAVQRITQAGAKPVSWCN
jgi:nicotinamidase-related amidase